MAMTRRGVFSLLAVAPAVAAGVGGIVRAQGTARSESGRKGLKLGARSKLVMVGDSITDAGRARPVGEGRLQTETHVLIEEYDMVLARAFVDAIGFDWMR